VANTVISLLAAVGLQLKGDLPSRASSTGRDALRAEIHPL